MTKKKVKFMYMHLIDGQPARYILNQQICYADQDAGRFMAKLVPTLKQIRKEQRATMAYRRHWNLYIDSNEYGYVKVILPD